LQRLDQGFLVDDGTPGRVDQKGVRLHQGELAPSDQLPGPVVQERMQRNSVGSLQQRVQIRHLDSRLICHGTDIVPQDLHLERESPLGHGLADVAHPDNPEDLPGRLRSVVVDAVVPPLHRGVEVENVLVPAQEERQDMLRHGDGIDARRVCRMDAPLRAFGDIHVVEARPGLDQPEFRGTVQKRSIDGDVLRDDHFRIGQFRLGISGCHDGDLPIGREARGYSFSRPFREIPDDDDFHFSPCAGTVSSLRRLPYRLSYIEDAAIRPIEKIKGGNKKVIPEAGGKTLSRTGSTNGHASDPGF